MEEIIYKTSDIYEASLLYAKRGNSFIALEGHGRNYTFVFKGKLCKKLSEKYHLRQVDVNARDYVNAIRSMKDLIFSRIREEQRRQNSF